MAKAPRGTTRRVGLDSSAGVVLDSANLGWHGLPLRAELQQRLGVPVVIDNDVCASALAELAALPGGSVCPWLYFSVGTGIGACVVLDAVEGAVFLRGRWPHAGPGRIAAVQVRKARLFGNRCLWPSLYSGRKGAHCRRPRA